MAGISLVDPTELTIFPNIIIYYSLKKQNKKSLPNLLAVRCTFLLLFTCRLSRSAPRNLPCRARGLITKPRPLAAIRDRRLNSVALLAPLRSVQFSSCQYVH